MILKLRRKAVGLSPMSLLNSNQKPFATACCKSSSCVLLFVRSLCRFRNTSLSLSGPLSSVVDNPGPGHYDLDDPKGIDLSIKLPVHSSMFKPSTHNRFGQPIVRRKKAVNNPGPGQYEISTCHFISLSLSLPSPFPVVSFSSRFLLPMFIACFALILPESSFTELQKGPEPDDIKVEKARKPFEAVGGGARGLVRNLVPTSSSVSLATQAANFQSTYLDSANLRDSIKSPFKSMLGKVVKEINAPDSKAFFLLTCPVFCLLRCFLYTTWIFLAFSLLFSLLFRSFSGPPQATSKVKPPGPAYYNPSSYSYQKSSFFLNKSSKWV
jgi:hypothetical protein